MCWYRNFEIRGWRNQRMAPFRGHRPYENKGWHRLGEAGDLGGDALADPDT